MPRIGTAQLKDKRPSRDDWGGEVGFYDYREAPEFLEHRQVIKDIIERHGPMVSREIWEHLGDQYDEQRSPSALDNLIGEIQRVKKGDLYFYRSVSETRQIEPAMYNNRRVK